MGILSGMKIAGVVSDAQKRYRGGSTVFVARLSGAPSVQGMPSGISDISDAIQAIEHEGWYLTNLTNSGTTDADRNVVVAMFRRKV